jgi:hypothetical protein
LKNKRRQLGENTKTANREKCLQKLGRKPYRDNNNVKQQKKISIN